MGGAPNPMPGCVPGCIMPPGVGSEDGSLLSAPSSIMGWGMGGSGGAIIGAIPGGPIIAGGPGIVIIGGRIIGPGPIGGPGPGPMCIPMGPGPMGPGPIGPGGGIIGMGTGAMPGPDWVIMIAGRRGWALACSAASRAALALDSYCSRDTGSAQSTTIPRICTVGARMMSSLSLSLSFSSPLSEGSSAYSSGSRTSTGSDSTFPMRWRSSRQLLTCFLGKGSLASGWLEGRPRDRRASSSSSRKCAKKDSGYRMYRNSRSPSAITRTVPRRHRRACATCSTDKSSMLVPGAKIPACKIRWANAIAAGSDRRTNSPVCSGPKTRGPSALRPGTGARPAAVSRATDHAPSS
mmetsp:Transcript_72478/g.193250  ORF Transcript_72478/g.193250 Transcript_72478/m.193250 type:complete len:349 (+) Transcript_72478:560-1606(+)